MPTRETDLLKEPEFCFEEDTMYTMSDDTKKKIHALVLAVEGFVYLEHVDPPASWDDRHAAQVKMEEAFYTLKAGSPATRAGDFERYMEWQHEHAVEAHDPTDAAALADLFDDLDYCAELSPAEVDAALVEYGYDLDKVHQWARELAAHARAMLDEMAKTLDNSPESVIQ